MYSSHLVQHDGTLSELLQFDNFSDYKDQQLSILVDRLQEAICDNHTREVERVTSLIQRLVRAWTPAELPAIQGFTMERLKLGKDIACSDQVPSWAVHRLAPENAIIFWYAKGGTGKSTLATQLGAAVVRGVPFFGLQTTQRPVVILDYENPLPVLKTRIDRTEGAEGIHFWTSQQDPPQLTDAVRFVELSELVRTLKNPLLIIDTLSGAACNADILSNRDFSPIMHRLKQLRDQGCTIILLHHTPKADETKYIGASTIYNQVDHVLAMYPVKALGSAAEVSEDDTGLFRFGTKDKTRYDHHTIYVEFNEETGLFQQAVDPDQKVIDQLKIIIETTGPINQTGIGRSIGSHVSDKKLRKLLKAHDGILWQSERGLKNSVNYFKIEPTSSPADELPSWYQHRCDSGEEATCENFY